MTRVPPARLASTVVLGLALALAGCTSDDDPQPDPTGATTTGATTAGTTTTESTMTSTTSDAAPATTAEEALQRAGLQVPPGATDITFEAITSDDSPLLEHYRVEFTLARDQAIAFCASGDLGGDLPALDLAAAEQERLGVEAATGADPRLCASQLPQNVAWDRVVLIEGDDPAHVIASLARMGR